MPKNRLVAANLSLEARSNGRVQSDRMYRRGNQSSVGGAVTLGIDGEHRSMLAVDASVLQRHVRMPSLHVLASVMLHYMRPKLCGRIIAISRLSF